MSFKKLRGFYGDAAINRFTAGADVADGDVVVSNTRVGVVHDERGQGVASGDEGLAIFATDEKGIEMPKATGAISQNAKVYWNPTGDPIGGTAGTGAVTATASTNLYLGRAVEAAASGDATVIVHLTNE